MIAKRTLAPNLMTVLNLLLGFIAIISATKGHFATGAWLIMIASIVDFLDGKVARATEGSSDFGIEFDSLADVVSFGVAPAFLIYSSQLSQLQKIEPLGIMISFLFLAAGAIRLARYNSSASDIEKRHFTGMPIPAGACLICSYVIFSTNVWGTVRFPGLTIALVLLASTLMVSTIEFDLMPKFSFRHGLRNTIHFILIFAAIVLITIFAEKALFPLFSAYILKQIARAFWNFLRNDDEESLPDISISKQ